jgi:hypothetical protein
MKPSANHIIFKTLKTMMLEQAEAPARVTNNADSANTSSPFTPAEEKFLGKFDAYGSRYLGIIYSISDIGIREFINRSGADLNMTPEILAKLLRDKIIKIIPYTGLGKNDDYTIELQLSLDDVAGLGAADKAKIEKGSTAAGGAEAATAAPSPELSWVVKYGDILQESANIAKTMLTEAVKKENTPKNGVYTKDSRMLKNLPKQYIRHLERLIDVLGKKQHTAMQRQRLIADILDNLSINLNLNDKQIRKSYEMFKNQKKLKKFLKDN